MKNRSVLVGIPVLHVEGWAKECIKSVHSQCDELLIIDNGTDENSKIFLDPYNKIVNRKNMYVNYAWNQIMEYFLESDHDYLVILNSDLILSKGSIDTIRKIDIDKEKVNIICNEVNEFSEFPSEEIITLDDGVPGIMIVLSRKMCELVYPIPDDLKIWYGDNWIYCKLQVMNYSFKIYKSIEARHGLSKSFYRLPDEEKGPIIDNDKQNWQTKYYKKIYNV